MKKKTLSVLAISFLVVVSVLIIYQKAFAYQACLLEMTDCIFWQYPESCMPELYECYDGWCWFGCICENLEAYSTACWYTDPPI